MKVFRAFLLFLLSSAFCLADAASVADETVYTVHGHNTWEDSLVRMSLSFDARWLLNEPIDKPSLLHLPDGRLRTDRLTANLKEVDRPTWCGQRILRVGTNAGKRAWYLEGESKPVLAEVPTNARVLCDRTGRKFAYFKRTPDPTVGPEPSVIYIGSAQGFKTVEVAAQVTDAVFSPDGQKLFVLVRMTDGHSNLYLVPIASSKPEMLAVDLDTVTFPMPLLSANEDGSLLFIILATDSAPDDARRQVPHDDGRWSKLYQFEVASRKLQLLRSAPNADLMSPQVINGYLYWIEQRSVRNVAMMPAQGGPMKDVTSDGESEQPSWSRDASQLAYLTGQYRLADYTLNWDIDVLAMDSEARPISTATRFIQGNNEDFTPDWSPNGRWIAWHSHRSSRLPVIYGDTASTDDIWLRLAGELHAPEIKLTSGGEETGWGHWSPNGRDILYSTWRPDAPGVDILRIVSIDPASGKPLGQRDVSLPKAVHSAQGCAWSPSGEQIAIEDSATNEDKILWIMNVEGSNLRRIAQYRSETYGGIDWTPDGKTLLFSGLENGRMKIFAANIKTGNVRRLADAATDNLLQPRASPDGKWISFWKGQTNQTIKRTLLPVKPE